ncbi:MAG: 16S rRNA (uracil(1498)-N(3))-methyltransferase, partial [Salinisphaeraceae bacterium]|nr:16S rRNA (uracil(1498)-N(3))-methyltransferase [Salinisphaeraceae bacterium]
IGPQQSTQRESPLQITLLQAVVRAERMDLSIGKAVELGVYAIQPLMLTRSQGMKTTQLQRKEKHWQAVAQSAAEQSGRTIRPDVYSTCSLTDWLAKQSAYDLKLLLHPGLDRAKPDVEATPRSLALLIGPEGGLSDEEVSLAQSAGFQGLTLGPRILRTETAAMAAITACQLQWGDL